MPEQHKFAAVFFCLPSQVFQAVKTLFGGISAVLRQGYVHGRQRLFAQRQGSACQKMEHRKSTADAAAEPLGFRVAERTVPFHPGIGPALPGVWGSKRQIVLAATENRNRRDLP